MAVSPCDNLAIYHRDEPKYWLLVTDAEKWEPAKTDFTDPLDQQSLARTQTQANGSKSIQLKQRRLKGLSKEGWGAVVGGGILWAEVFPLI